MSTRARVTILAVAAAVATIFSSVSKAYVPSGSTWSTAQVPYYVNPVNMDLPATSVGAAVQSGAGIWYSQSGAALSFSFIGELLQTATTFDGINLVVFRNASNGSAIATTYWWTSGSQMLDADIVFWDGAFRFFSGTSGCSNGFYIEDIAAHEFGHVLGLLHSASTAATMYSSTSWCNTGIRTLDADDIAGVRALYPPKGLPSAPGGLRFMN